MDSATLFIRKLARLRALGRFASRRSGLDWTSATIVFHQQFFDNRVSALSLQARAARAAGNQSRHF